MGSPIRECGAISRAKSEPLRRARSSRLGRADPVAQHLETLDAALEAIAGLQRPDARGRAGEDEMARPELVEPRECRDDVRDVPHHRAHVRFLAPLAVDGGPDAAPHIIAALSRLYELRPGDLI